MHDKIELIRQALNVAQDNELKLSALALEALKDINHNLFAIEESIQALEYQNDIQKAEIEKLESELVQLGRVAHG